MGKSLILLLILQINLAIGATPVYPFDTPQQEIRFQHLTEELRCLVCQNQNLADSNAPLAADLRQQIYQKIIAGQSDKTIKAYLTKRYGEFILYRPPMAGPSIILWIAPGFMLLLGAIILLMVIRRRAEVTP